MSEYDYYIAVVDPELRVRGMEGLRVAEDSVMIGEKATDLVRGAGVIPVPTRGRLCLTASR